MTRLAQAGGEFRHVHPDGFSTGTLAVLFDTTLKRSGVASAKIDSTGTNSTAIYRVDLPATGVLGRNYYLSSWFYIPSGTGYPSTASRLFGLNGPTGGTIAGLFLRTDGTLRIYDSGLTQIGTASSAVPQDTWFQVGVRILIDTGAIDQIEAKLNGVTFENLSGLTLAETNSIARCQLGWNGAAGANKVINIDDVIINDDQGSANNTWPDGDKIIISLPTGDVAIGNWTDATGGTTNLFECVNNIPPIGEAPASGTTATAQIENPVATAGNSYDATMQSYTAIGIGAADTVTAVFPVVAAGSSATTGADTLDISVVSNPSIAADPASCDASAGVYPTGWIRGQGNVADVPTVTKGTAPVMRATKNVATTRINSCCLMALSVAYTVGTSPVAERYRTLLRAG